MQASVTSDAARMDRHYRYQRYIYDATRTHYLIGRKHLITQLRPAPGNRILEIGCGTAWNLVKAARRYPEASLFGVDVSNAMLDTASASLAHQGVSNRVTLNQGDATNFDPRTTFDQESFDRVFFSYALSMIPGWVLALNHAAGMLAPGGELHIVDFGQCERLPKAFKRMLFAFLSHYTVTPRYDFEPHICDTAQLHGLSVEFQRLHRGYTDYAKLCRH
ncbi:MAG: class I SAM-dependent methyltransferase [Hyphomicrobiaceae bacterium]